MYSIHYSRNSFNSCVHKQFALESEIAEDMVSADLISLHHFVYAQMYIRIRTVSVMWMTPLSKSTLNLIRVVSDGALSRPTWGRASSSTNTGRTMTTSLSPSQSGTKVVMWGNPLTSSPTCSMRTVPAPWSVWRSGSRDTSVERLTNRYWEIWHPSERMGLILPISTIELDVHMRGILLCITPLSTARWVVIFMPHSC